MTAWIIRYDCDEYVYVEGLTRAQAETRPDDLGCLPVRVLRAGDVEIEGVWEKNGVCRVTVRERSEGCSTE